MTSAAGGEKTRCPQCLEWQHPREFLGVRRKPVRWCRACRAHYKGWGTKTEAEKEAARASRRRTFSAAGAFRVRWVARSTNAKTGPIPITLTERGSCPDSCSLKNRGCYAEEHNFMRYHWERTSELGLWWDEFLDRVEALPPGQVWRHNEAGDLPGEGDRIAPGALFALAEANAGRRGFTFSHKPLSPPNAAAIRRAVALGFAINLSADSLPEADRLAAAGVAPVSVVLPADWGDRAWKTPGGRTVVVCPAQTTRGMTCERCRLCAVLDRKSIVGFRAHGKRASLVTEIVRARRPGDPAPGARPAAAPAAGGQRVRAVPLPASSPGPARARGLPAVLRDARGAGGAARPPRVDAHVPEVRDAGAARREERAAAAVAAARARVADLLARGRGAARAAGG